MLRKLKNINLDPPGGWQFHHEESGATIESGHFMALVDDVRIFLRRNNCEVPENLAAIVEDQICGGVPESMIRLGKPDRIIRTATMLWSGTQLIMDAVVNGKRFVPPEEAERRAQICANCPLNIKDANCTGCKGFYGIIRSWYQHRTTGFDDFLFICDICGCLNTAQIHAPAEVLRKVTPKSLVDKYPSQGCWKYDVLHEEKNHAAEENKKTD